MTKIVTDIFSWLKRQEKIGKTVRELSQLTERDLSDIGINRCDIYRIARSTTNVALYSR